jgi:hypothetical protein
MAKLAIVLFTLLLAGCPSHSKHVLIVGDSISALVAGHLSDVGNLADYRVTYTTVATGGIGVTQSFSGNPYTYWPELMIDALQGRDFDLVIVALGTNDCYNAVSTQQYAISASLMADAIHDADPDVQMVWLTVNGWPHLPDCSPIINSALDAAGIQTLPYYEWSESHPEYFISDAIHHTEIGKLEYARWIQLKVEGLLDVD